MQHHAEPSPTADYTVGIFRLSLDYIYSWLIAKNYSLFSPALESSNYKLLKFAWWKKQQREQA